MEQRYARPRKPASRGAVCDGLGCGFDGGPVNKFPARHQILAQPLRGFPRLCRTRKPAVPAGHGIARKCASRPCVATALRRHADWCPWACAKLADHSNRAKSFRAVPCPAKRVSVSAGSGGDAEASQGHGMAVSVLARNGAIPCPQGRQRRPAATAASVVARSAHFSTIHQ